jgi:hypothetical protein
LLESLESSQIGNEHENSVFILPQMLFDDTQDHDDACNSGTNTSNSVSQVETPEPELAMCAGDHVYQLQFMKKD